MKQQNLFARMDSLHKYTPPVYPLPPNLAQEYEDIDKAVCELMDAAERKCHKLKAGDLGPQIIISLALLLPIGKDTNSIIRVYGNMTPEPL